MTKFDARKDQLQEQPISGAQEECGSVEIDMEHRETKALPMAVLTIDLGPAETELQHERLPIEIDLGPAESDPTTGQKSWVLGPGWGSLEEVEKPEQEIQFVQKLSPRLRQLMVLMERPFFALNKARMKPIDYISPDGRIQVLIEPGPSGMATIYDADLLIFLVTRLSVEKQTHNEAILLRPVEFFETVGSKKGGGQYRLLEASLSRLATTRVTTNAQFDGKPGQDQRFCWLEDVRRVKDGFLIKPCPWLQAGARSNYVLSINPDYFGISGIERNLYLTARKHVGRKFGSIFSIKIDTLFLKSGSAGQKSRFKHDVRSFVARDALPDYTLRWQPRGRQSPIVEMCWDGVSGPERVRRRS